MGICIETERLRLRELAPDELPRLARIAREEAVGRWLPDWRDCEGWGERWMCFVRQGYAIGDPLVQYILLAVEEKATGRLVGQINTGCQFEDVLPGELSVGYFISEAAAGKGLATEAARGLTGHYFRRLNNRFFMALVKPGNAASRRVVEKTGFAYRRDVESEGETYRYYRLYR